MSAPNSSAAAQTRTAVTPLVARARDRVVYEKKVPSDIAISQAVAPLPIAEIAADAGLLPSEVGVKGARAR